MREMQQIFATLMAKKKELDTLLNAKNELESQMRDAMQAEAPAPAKSPPKSPPKPTMAEASTEARPTEKELDEIAAHRQRAQLAVEEQERKLSELTALQAALRSRLNELEAQQDEEAPAAATSFEEEEEEEDVDEDGLDMAQKLHDLISIKTAECEKLAAVVEEAREAGMSADNPRLQAAERNLAYRYSEVKELAAIADKLGLSMEEEEEMDEAGQAATAPSGAQESALHARAEQAAASKQAALENVHRLQQELESCLQQLRMIDSSTSDSVARHPAFLRMRRSVEQKMQMLHTQLGEARAVYEHEVKMSDEASMALSQHRQDAQEPHMDLTPMLKEALDNLWQRPYDARVFLLQLLQALAELDDRSVCMMASCFARYLETHSAPAQ